MTSQYEQTQLLKEILKWLKFAGMNQAKSILTTTLESDVDKLAYQKSDGTIGTVALGKLVGVSNKTIDNMWDSWLKMGLGESIPVSGGTRFKRSFDLEDFGIKVPEVNVVTAKEKLKKEPEKTEEAQTQP
jgi:hypothetical protein